MRTEMLTGQYLDMTGETLPYCDADNAQKVNRFKTAAYTIERPLHIGAACANASPERSSHKERLLTHTCVLSPMFVKSPEHATISSRTSCGEGDFVWLIQQVLPTLNYVA
jgi:hypothetical protein